MGQETASNNERLLEITKAYNDALIQVNDKFIIEFIWNKRINKTLIPPQLLNKDLEELIRVFDLQFTKAEVIKFIQEKSRKKDLKPLQIKYKIKPEKKWALINLVRIDTDENHYTLITVKDISKLKSSEENLIKNLEKQKKLTELKDRFINMTSHELRTPLTSINTSSELIKMHLERSKYDHIDSIDKYFKNIEFEVERMVHLLNDILLLGKLGAGKMPIKKEQVDFPEMVKLMIEKLFTSRRIPNEVKIITSGNVQIVRIDKLIIEHTLENLLSNAFKYSPNSKSPIVYLKFSEGFFSITVKDFGIGIPKKDQEKIMEQFYRASNAGKINGVGLGLSIIKQLMELHQATIEIKSKENSGTNVIIKFKYQ